MNSRMMSEIFYVKSTKMHYHEDDLQILLVLDGTIELTKIERTSVIHKGQIAIINKNIVHRISSEGAYVLSTKIKLSYFKHIYKRIEYVEFITLDEFNQNIEKIFKPRFANILIDLLVKRYMFSSKRILNKELEFAEDQLVQTLYSTYQLIGQMKSENDFLNEELLDRYYYVVEYVSNHIDQKILTEDIIKNLYMNPTYFSQFMKKVGGVGFKEFVLYRKLIHISIYLSSTQYSMDQVATKLGITDMKSFYNIFKKYYKMSPSKWKKMISTYEDDYYEVKEDAVKDYIDEIHVLKNKDNTISYVLKYLLLCKDYKELKNSGIIIDVYKDCVQGDLLYPAYNNIFMLLRIAKEYDISLIWRYEYHDLKMQENLELLIEFLKFSIFHVGYNEVRKWQIVLKGKNYMEIEMLKEIKSIILKKTEIINVHICLDIR